MSRSRGTIALVLLAVAAMSVGVAVWFDGERANPPVQDRRVRSANDADTTTTASTTSPEIATLPARPSAERAPGSTDAEPLPEGTIGETYATLARLADEGNGAAALRLATLVGLCATYVPRSRETAEQELVEGLAVFDSPRTEKEARDQDAMVAIAVEVQDWQRVECPGFATLGIGDPLAEQRRWTQAAARLGEARALVDMADAMIKKYRTPGEIVEHAEELRLLRGQAIALLQQAVAAGEPAALLRMAAAHRTGDLAPIDPVEAYAWMLAYRAGPPSPDFPRTAFDHVLRRLEEPLDETQRAEAQRRADAIRARCCGGG